HCRFVPTLTPTTQLHTLSLHDALPIYQNPASRTTKPHPDWWWRAWPQLRRYSWARTRRPDPRGRRRFVSKRRQVGPPVGEVQDRSEEHTSELQSRENLVCRLLLEKKNE